MQSKGVPMKILCFDIVYVGFGRKEDNLWKAYAKRGDRVGAIKNLRKVYNEPYPDTEDPRRMNLKKALLKVTNYMKRKRIQAIN